MQNVALKIAHSASQRVQSVVEALTDLVLDDESVERGRQELKDLLEDVIEIIAESLNQVALESQQLTHDLFHLQEVLLWLRITALVEQVERVDDADGTAYLLNFDIVLVDQIQELAFNKLLIYVYMRQLRGAGVLSRNGTRLVHILIRLLRHLPLVLVIQPLLL